MRSQHAEGAARAVRPPDGAVAGARGARRRARAGGGRRLAGAGARGGAARGRRAGGAAAPERHRRSGGGGDGALVAAGRGRRDRTRSAPVVVLSGDVPLVSAEAIAELVRGARARAARAATMVTTMLEDPSGYGRVVRDATVRWSAWWRRRQPGDATHGGARDRRGEHGHLRVRRRARCSDGAAAAERRQRAGRAVSAAGARPAASGRRDGRGARGRRRDAGARASTTAWRSRACARSRRQRSTSGTCARAWTSSIPRRR